MPKVICTYFENYKNWLPTTDPPKLGYIMGYRTNYTIPIRNQNKCVLYILK